MEQEREHDNDDEEGVAIGSGTGDLILYGIIAAILASIGYTGFKIMSTKRKSSSSLK